MSRKVEARIADIRVAIARCHWPAIRGMRNVLIHEYFGVDTAVVRDVIDAKLGVLDEACAKYLTEDSERGEQ